MRVLFQAPMAFVLAWAVPSISPGGNPNEHGCATNSGAEQIASCTAWIDGSILGVDEMANAFYIRAGAYWDQKSYTRAIADVSIVVRLRPKDPNAFKLRADAYMMQNKFALAVADYDKVIRLDPGMAMSFNNRGWAYYRLNKYALAVADYDAAIRRGARSAQAFYIRGLAKGKLGQSAASQADISQAIAIDMNIAKEIAAVLGR